MSRLPIPSSNCMDKIKALLYKFTWNNKTDKIKRKGINQNHTLGGCKMTDSTVQNRPLKLSWIPCIFENKDSFLVQCIQANLYFPFEVILLGNLNKKDMEKCMSNCINMFWCNISQN